MSLIASLTPSQIYFLVCATTIAVCWFGAWYAANNPRVALFSTIAIFPIFFTSWLFNQNYPSSSHATSAAIFVNLKMFSVFIPITLFAYANFNFSRSKIQSIPKYVTSFFSIVLCLNILETLLVAADKPSTNSAVYAILAIALGISALFLRWDVKEDIFGFTDKPFVIAYLACLSYLFLFLFSTGPGWIAWVLLLIPYFPFSRAGHPWMAYRAYSLWIYLNFAQTMGLRPFYRSAPQELEELTSAMRNSWMNELVLLIAVGSVVYLVYDRLTAAKRSTNEILATK